MLKQEALRQILDKKYYPELKGEVIGIGLAHDKNRCGMVYKDIAQQQRLPNAKKVRFLSFLCDFVKKMRLIIFPCYSNIN